MTNLIDKVATTVRELRELKGEQVYLLLFNTENTLIEYAAATSIVKIIAYIRTHNLYSKISIEKSMLLRGYVYLAEELPYDLDVDEVAYVIADDYDFIDFGNMETCTEYIEEQLNSLYEDIDNFAVIIGDELPIKQQHRVINRILFNKRKMEAANE